MLICSKFHDYYDSITAFGIDKTVVYQRAESPIEQLDKGPEIYGSNWGNPYRLEACRIIGFCGKLYPLLEIRTSRCHQLIYDPEKATEQSSESGRRTYRSLRFTNIPDCFNIDNFKSLLPLFVERKVPCFIYGDYLEEKYPGKSRQLILNPRLDRWRFQSVKDPVTAFQDIYLYISGVLGTPVNPTVEITDKYKAIAHGHDGKYSFRKPPGEKKPRHKRK